MISQNSHALPKEILGLHVISSNASMEVAFVWQAPSGAIFSGCVVLSDRTRKKFCFADSLIQIFMFWMVQ